MRQALRRNSSTMERPWAGDPLDDFRIPNVKNRTAPALLRHLGRVGRTLPYDLRGRGRIASTLTSLLLKSGAEPIVHCDMAAGQRLRLDCRVPSHCWTFLPASTTTRSDLHCSRSCV